MGRKKGIKGKRKAEIRRNSKTPRNGEVWKEAEKKGGGGGADEQKDR